MKESVPRKDGKYKWSKVGYQPAVGTSDRSIWSEASAYVFPASAGKISAISGSANDTSDGTGARTIKIWYLTTAFIEKSTILTMNGTTLVVSTVADVYRINHAKILTTGTGKTGAGKISIGNEGGTVIYSTILAGENEQKQIVYTVPAGRTLIIDKIIASNVATTALKYATLKVLSTYCPYCDLQQSALLCSYQISLDQSVVPYSDEDGLRFPAGTDIVMNAIGVAGGIMTISAYGHEE